MTIQQDFDTHQAAGGFAGARLRPAESRSARAPSHAIGPFEITAAQRKAPGLGEAMVTSLLVIYPAFATVAAIVAGLFLAGASGA